MTSNSKGNQRFTQTDESSRWRVVVVRLGSGAVERIHAAYPVTRSLNFDVLPLVVRSTGDQQNAEWTASGLRELGAVVIVSQEPTSAKSSAYCSRHRSFLAIHNCLRCGETLCRVCLEQFNGERYCQNCAAEALSPRRRTRLRQLFMLFLFTVFIYFVVDYLQSEREGIDPNGLVRVGMLQFIPPEHVGVDILQTLNGLDRRRSEGTSLYDIAPWYNKERARYGGTRMPYMQVEVLGPWAADMSPPKLPNSASGYLENLYGAWSYSRHFTSMADRLGVDLGDYGVRSFVVYRGGSEDWAAHSRGSKKGHLAVSYVDVEENNPAYAVVTVAHEIGHALGADDSYDLETGLATFPSGFVNPVGDDLYPQQFAELMSPDIPVAPTEEVEVQSLYQVRIGHQSAAQLLWITQEEADAFYSGPTVMGTQSSFLEMNNQSSASETTAGTPND